MARFEVDQKMPVECEKNRTQLEATFGRIRGAIQVRQEQWARAAAAPSPAVIFRFKNSRTREAQRQLVRCSLRLELETPTFSASAPAAQDSLTSMRGQCANQTQLAEPVRQRGLAILLRAGYGLRPSDSATSETIGKQAVQDLLSLRAIQAKLATSQPGGS